MMFEKISEKSYNKLIVTLYTFGGLLMRKVALITDNWKQFMISAWPYGIVDRMRRKGAEGTLYIFNSAGCWSLDESYNRAEYNIMRLADFTKFDAVIADFNNFSVQDEVDEIIDRIKKAGIPAVSLGKEIDGFYYAGVDNYAAMWQVIEHLNEHHGMKRFWGIFADPSNFESAERERAVKDYLDSHNLSYSENDFAHGDFAYQSGVVCYKKLRLTHEGFPDAFICANDNLAISVCEEAAKEGKKVPRDFAVTGFDNFDKASFYTPRITTVENAREDIAYLAMDMILALWRGEKIERKQYIKTELVSQESCGCHGDPFDMNQYLRKQILSGVDTDRYEEELMNMESEVMQCNDAKSVVAVARASLPSFRVEGLCVVIDDHVFDYHDDDGRGEMAAPELMEFNIKGYSSNMHVLYADGCFRGMEGEKAEEDIFKKYLLEKQGEDVLFMPLHFGKYTVGYYVTKSAIPMMLSQRFFEIMRIISRRLEELFRSEKLNYVNVRLENLYKRDTLTGLFNRRGIRIDGEALYRRAIENKDTVLITFTDLDRLKYINDKFGHDYGDLALKGVAESLKSALNSDAIIARTGGDEFVGIEKISGPVDFDSIRERIEDKMIDIGSHGNFDFPYSASTGFVLAKPDGSKSLDEYINDADEKMYIEKQKNHRKTDYLTEMQDDEDE